MNRFVHELGAGGVGKGTADPDSVKKKKVHTYIRYFLSSADAPLGGPVKGTCAEYVF